MSGHGRSDLEHRIASGADYQSERASPQVESARSRVGEGKKLVAAGAGDKLAMRASGDADLEQDFVSGRRLWAAADSVRIRF